MCAGGPGSMIDPQSGQDRLCLPSLWGIKNEEQLVSSWVAATEDCGVKACGCEIVTCDLCGRRHKLYHSYIAS